MPSTPRRRSSHRDRAWRPEVDLLEGRALLSTIAARDPRGIDAPSTVTEVAIDPHRKVANLKAHASLALRSHRAATPGSVRPQTAATAPYDPAQIRHAYGVDQLTETGAGQTIAIVDAYNDPTIAADLHTFDSQFGLTDPTLNIVKQTSGNRTPAYNSGWATEISLDVEWAHAIAPNATILLYEAYSSSYSNLLAGVSYAVSHGASQVSMSWGGSETSGYDSYFDHPGVTFLNASGDDGYGASTPATSPYVTGVGGTSLAIDTNSNRITETGWSGSGGGVSTIETLPSYQSGFFSNSHRGEPDVSYDADPNTGYYVYDNSNGRGGWYQVGGTSAGAPQWGGLIALANQGRVAASKATLGSGTTYGTNQVLYNLAGGSSYTNARGDFYDITSGSNGAATATTGYDLVTGLGSPVANKLIPDLISS